MGPRKTSKTEIVTDAANVASGILSAGRIIRILLNLFKSIR